MNKKLKIATLSLLGLTVAAAVAYIIYRKRNEDKIGEDKITDNLEEVAAKLTSDNSPVFPLRYNPTRKLKEVKALQKYINLYVDDFNEYVLKPLDVDGYFGDRTKTLCLKFLKTDEVKESYYKCFIKEFEDPA